MTDARVNRTTGSAGIPNPAEIQIPKIDPTGSQDGKNEVCGVEILTGTPDAVRLLLKPQTDYSNHKFFADQNKITERDKAQGKKAQGKGEEYLQAASQVLMQANQAMQSGDVKKANQLKDQGTQKMQQAFESFSKAFALTQDPSDKKLMQELAYAATQIGHTGLGAELYRILLSDHPCDFQTRQERAMANQALIMTVQATINQIPKSRHQEIAKRVGRAEQEIILDQGLMVNRSTKDLSAAIGKTLEGYTEMSADDKAKALQQALPLVAQLIQLKDAAPEAKIYGETFASHPGFEAKKTLSTILKFTGESDDTQVQQYHRAFHVLYHQNFGNPAYAFQLTETIVQEGLKELGDGDAEAGQKALNKILAKVKGAKSPGDAQAVMEELIALPPGFIEAYEIQEQVKGMKKIRQEGLLALGSGDVAQGQKKVEDFLKQANAIEAELNQLNQEGQKLMQAGKKDEAEKIANQFKEKKTKGEAMVQEFAKGFSSQEEAVAFLDAYQSLKGMEDLQKQEKVKRAMTFLDKLSQGLYDAKVDSELEPTYSNAAWWFIKGAFYAGPRALITGNSNVDDYLAIQQTDANIFHEMKGILRRQEAATMSEAAEQVKRDGSDEVKERLSELLDGETGFDMKLLMDYCSTPESDPIKAKALLAEAQKLKEQDVHLVRAAWALETLVTETCSDPEVLKLAQEQRKSESKAA